MAQQTLAVDTRTRPTNRDGNQCFLNASVTALFASQEICRTLQNIREMETTLTDHHKLILQLYGVELVKPKLHYMHHIPRNIETVGDVLSCFSAERKHKFAKTIGQHSDGEHWEYQVLKKKAGLGRHRAVRWRIGA